MATRNHQSHPVFSSLQEHPGPERGRCEANILLKLQSKIERGIGLLGSYLTLEAICMQAPGNSIQAPGCFRRKHEGR